MMYCKKCNKMLEEGNHICPHCGYDNDATTDLSDIVNEMNRLNNKKTSKTSIVIIIILLLCGLIGMYLFKDSRATNDNENKVDIPTTAPTNSKLKQMKYDNLVLEYSDNFGTSTNTIFYKNNSVINIVITNITPEEYSNYINGNECLDSKLNDIVTKTFASDTSYSHVFMINNKYYMITVNYIDDVSVYNENIQLEISKILNSIKEK